MLDKFRPLLLPVLLLSFLFSMPNVGGKYWMVPSNVALWLSAGVFIALTLIVIMQKKQLIIAPTQKYLFALLLLLLVFGSFNSELSVEQLMIYWSAFGFIWLFYIAMGQFEFSSSEFYQFIFTVVLFGAVQSLIGLVQIYDEQYRLFHLWFGYEPFRIVGAATGSFQQPNMLASFLSLSLIASFVLFYAQNSYIINNTKRILILISSFFMFTIILSSGSRAGLLAFIIPLVLFSFFYFKRIYSQPANMILMIVAFVFAWTLLWYVNGNLSGLDHIANKVIRISEGGDARIHLYSSAMSMFLDSPWLGYGIGGYQEAFHAFYAGKELPVGLNESVYTRMTHPHNELLFWMLQSGVVALLSIIVFIILFMKRMIFVSDKTKVIILLTLPILIQAMLSYPFGLSALHLFLLLILLSFGDKAHTIINIKNIGQVVLATSSLLIIIFVTLSAHKTYQSVYETHYFFNRMYLYAVDEYEGFEARGYFVNASNHLLFKGVVEESMDQMLENAIKEKNIYDVEQFVKWCENAKVENKSNCQIANKFLLNNKGVQQP